MTAMEPVRAAPLPDETFIVPSGENGSRLDRFLMRRLKALSRTRIQAIIKERTRVEGRRARASLRLRAGDRVTVGGRKDRGPSVLPPVAVIHADRDLVVVNKPAGLLSHPSGAVHRFTVLGCLAEQLAAARLFPVHRLDRTTSGVMVVARTPEAGRLLSAMFRKGQVRKEYVAVLCGRCGCAEYTVTAPLPTSGRARTPRPAWTRFVRLGTDGDPTVVLARPLTGRRHQIRMHAAGMGHPVLGDRRYGGGAGPVPGRIYLHARRIALPGPVAYPPFTAPLPPEIRRFLPED